MGDSRKNASGQLQNEDPWHDDILDRRDFSEFLTTVLIEQTLASSKRQNRGLTIAIDAEWGAGKTFFIERWSQTLRHQGHPVIIFDAWKHDLGEAPVIVLMAAINHALDEWISRAPIKTEIKQRTAELGREGIRQLRRAVLPTTGVILSGLLKKATGVAWKDLKEAASLSGDEEEDAEVISSESDSLTGEDQGKIDSGLDRIFEKVLNDQTQRIEAIGLFRSELAKIIDVIRGEGGANIPVFVFIDELDRCRPSYAISLLEEIKHVFGIENVCFVVSTNLKQLCHSVRSVYGHEFDSEHYLKRFFDHTHAIPSPENKKYVDLLLAEHESFSSRKCVSGISVNKSNAHAISVIFEALGLDLRSQKQVFRIATTAASAIPHENFVHTLWLFFLAALVHKDQGIYSDLHRKKPKAQEFKNKILNIISEDKKITYFRQGRKEDIKLSDVLSNYYSWSNLNVKELHELIGSSDNVYPNENLMMLGRDLPGSWDWEDPPSSLIGKYFDFVKYAGYVGKVIE